MAKFTAPDHGGVYVTHLDGVYDVTDFVKYHPGGNKIMLAAGASVDPYWRVYKQHLTENVLEILEDMRVGTLVDYSPSAEAQEVVLDPYENEPSNRSEQLVVHSEQPFCAGTVEAQIPLHYITPSELMYVRHNNPVPALEEYTLGLGWGIQLSLQDLKDKFTPHEVVMTLICAGNRREEINEVEPVVGLAWKSDAVSTARWKGVLLKDLRALIEDGGPGANETKHVWFMGRDHPYDASIPVAKAFADKGDVLVAYELNGQPISRDHGGPVRVVVPGHVAARSVKWLEKIQVSRDESESYWQRGPAYKSFGPDIKKLEGVHSEDFPSLQEVPVQSAICTYEWNPQGDRIDVHGWAWSGGGRKIVRVEVSTDGGKHWQPAKLGEGKDQPLGRAWAWTFWGCEAEVAAGQEEVELVVRCCDESFNVQPESAIAVWNIRGNYNNSYHRVKVDNPKK